ncbi:hypothetical protein BU26DRAFT_242183 [Trematosphaeria pertusa]|uniref:Uncharacterized protein n=1 Tax=Trematosphaeria pertusa TaxID=390896 RepID=A0A6A6IPJ9_9PLEO|nr:uncharacterized protein BU26DRAFT_242183 [Trematosphaeria pertusa]KAF2251722.1 hypothetical protein BU26DRAFT_242183 [Trematosphaeria pertusa]
METRSCAGLPWCACGVLGMKSWKSNVYTRTALIGRARMRRLGFVGGRSGARVVPLSKNNTGLARNAKAGMRSGLSRSPDSTCVC